MARMENASVFRDSLHPQVIKAALGSMTVGKNFVPSSVRHSHCLGPKGSIPLSHVSRNPSALAHLFSPVTEAILGPLLPLRTENHPVYPYEKPPLGTPVRRVQQVSFKRDLLGTSEVQSQPRHTFLLHLEIMLALVPGE